MDRPHDPRPRSYARRPPSREIRSTGKLSPPPAPAAPAAAPRDAPHPAQSLQAALSGPAAAPCILAAVSLFNNLMRRTGTFVAGALLVTPQVVAAADDLLIEVHFKPVPNVQIAIWIEDRDGNFAEDLLVTQATGKLGIGNRPGIWNFVGSWRAPYGPRESVLPVWAHRRGKQYPKLVFFDDDPGDDKSLGWHENTSTAENYYCRPLTQSEHDVISVDSMTCPSPNVFQTDKGVFDPNQTSPYPPRNDILEVEPGVDSPDVGQLAALNELDAVTAATPIGNAPEYIVATIPAEIVANAPLTAWIEVSLEHDENSAYDFDRDSDHFVDQRLANYGIEYLGQPSVVYKVEFDPRDEGFLGTSDYAGYGDWDGKSGDLHPPDATISTADGSGADRLLKYTLNGDTFRFGVYSYGDGPVDPPGGDTGDTGDTVDPDTGDTGDTGGASIGGDNGGGDDDGGGDDGGIGGGGWGQCRPAELAAISDLSLEGMSFDKVRVHYTIPAAQDPKFELYKLHVYRLTGETALTEDNLGSAFEHPIDLAAVAAPGARGEIELDQLWGNYTYQFGVTYEDKCGNTSPLVTAGITTEPQKFQTVEGFCFLATAAYGAAWVTQVQALRYFRDAYLKVSPMGRDMVRFYYTYSPPLARVIQHQPLLRGMVRVVLQPVTDVARLGAL
jgi:hypothetical protein